MSSVTDVLAIDDDKLIHKIVSKALASDELSIRIANSGEAGLEQATAQIPDIILLDVEMPGLNGYEVCEQLRNNDLTRHVPIIFLSSRSSLRERMQGYEVGGDDYLVKPFEQENLLARIHILLRYQNERRDLKHLLQRAEETAITAITGSADLGQALQFLEKSIAYNSQEELMMGLFEGTLRLSLNCCAMLTIEQEHIWYSPQEIISPLEKELLEMSDPTERFLDFGQRTIVNFPLVSLLIRNMPLNDQELYGRLKDLLPILLSAVNVKLGALETKKALNQQSEDMLVLFKNIRGNLFHMGKTIVGNRKESTEVTSNLVQDLRTDLFRMGLEDDQEDYLVERMDSVIDDVREHMDSGAEFRYLLSYIISNLKVVVEKQEKLLESYNNSQISDSENQTDELDDDIVLF